MRFGQRYDTAARWLLADPVLALGEIGIEFDTGNIKIGNGTLAWSDLPYTVVTDKVWIGLTQAATLAVGRKYMCNTSGGGFIVTLPATPAQLNKIVISDYAGTFGTNNLTVNRNGKPIMGLAENLTLDVSNATVTFEFIDNTKGWLVS